MSQLTLFNCIRSESSHRKQPRIESTDDSTPLPSSLASDTGTSAAPTISGQQSVNKTPNEVLLTIRAGDIAQSPAFLPVQPKHI